MNKIFYQGDQDDVLASCHGEMVRLVETDRMTKQAASSAFPNLSAYKPDADHFMLHVVAMGAHPRYLPNRNGDAFTANDLRSSHDTFVKMGHFFREHKNRDPKHAIGIIKASAYNEDLDRVELIVWGDKRKAEEEYELAKKGCELSFSMSANLKEDECSCCGHRARRLSDHCEHLTDSMNQYLPGFRKYAFAFNPDPKFFDISRVKRPADRIAHYLEYMFDDAPEMAKAASAQGIVIPGAAWAEYEGVDLEKAASEDDEFSKGIRILSLLEDKINHWECHGFPKTPEGQYMGNVLKSAFHMTEGEVLPEALEKLDPGVLFQKLASNRIVMPFDMFCSYATGRKLSDLKQDEDYIKSASQLPNLFTLLKKDASHVGDIAVNFAPSRANVSKCIHNTDEVDSIMESMRRKFSCDIEPVQSRTIVIIMSKGASNKLIVPNEYKDEPLGKLASVYGAYQLSILTAPIPMYQADADAFLHGVLAMNRYGKGLT